METRNDKFPHNGGFPINLSVAGANGLNALMEEDTTLIAVYGGRAGSGSVVYAKTIEEKRELTFSYLRILVAWPGVYTQDIFYIDDMDAARHALGLVLKKEKKKQKGKQVEYWIDDDSRKWVVA